MNNQIIQHIERVRYNMSKQQRLCLPSVPRTDFGCIKPNAEFNLRAADLLAGMEADQFEDLLEALADVCKNVHDVSGDEAYLKAAQTLDLARQDIASRKGD